MTTNPAPPSTPQPAPSLTPASQARLLETPHPGTDPFPVWLLLSICAGVLAVVWFLLAPNWQKEFLRWLSLDQQKRGNYSRAIKALDYLKVKGDPPYNPTILSEIAYSYSQLKQYDKAIEYYLLAEKNAANQPPDDQGNPRPQPDFSTRLGHTYYLMNDMPKAQEYLTKALKRDKLDKTANFTMGEILMKQDDYLKATEYFKVVARDPVYEDRVKNYYAEIEKELFAGIG